MNRELTRRNLTQQLVHTLGKTIVQGRFKDELGIQSEAEICEKFDISRSAAREAVKMLTAKGLVSSRPRQGILIQPRERWNMFDPDVLEWVIHGTPSREMLKDFQQLRIAVEPEASALAAEHQDLDKIALVGEALERMKEAVDNSFDPLEADIAFHLGILVASGNPFYVQLRSFIEAALRVNIRYTNRIRGIDMGSYKSHKKVYEAILKGNPDSARKASKSLQNEAIELINDGLAEEST